MSQENVEVVAEVLAEFKRTHQAVVRLLTSDFIYDMRGFRGWPDAQEYVGAEALNDFFAAWMEPYDEWDLDVEDVLDAGNDRVVAITTQRGRLREADSWVELRHAQIYTLTGGLVSRTEVFASPEEALEAAGLSE